MNLRVILFLVAVVVLFLCVTGTKVRDKNMQKLVKFSVPIVLFVALMLCMSKNVEPYCESPSQAILTKYGELRNERKEVVNQGSPILGDKRMGFNVNFANTYTTTGESPIEWTGGADVCGPDLATFYTEPAGWQTNSAPPQNNRGAAWQGGITTDPGTSAFCKTACEDKTSREADGTEGRSFYEFDNENDSQTSASQCIAALKDDPNNPLTVAPFLESIREDVGEYLSADSTAVTDVYYGRGILTEICNNMRGAPNEEQAECLGLTLNYDEDDPQTCTGLRNEFEDLVNSESYEDCRLTSKCDSVTRSPCQNAGTCDRVTMDGTCTLPTYKPEFADCVESGADGKCIDSFGTGLLQCQPLEDCGALPTDQCSEPVLKTDGTTYDREDDGSCKLKNSDDTTSCMNGAISGRCDSGSCVPTPTPPGRPTSASGYREIHIENIGTDTGSLGSSTIYRIYAVIGADYNVIYSGSSVTASTDEATIYSIYWSNPDESNVELIFPACYQVAQPFGVNYGGVNPAFFTVSPGSDKDSWLTVSSEDGSSFTSMSSSGPAPSTSSTPSRGMNNVLDGWNETTKINVNSTTDPLGGALFWMNPREAPSPVMISSIVRGGTLIAQLNVPDSIVDREIAFGVQGKKQDGSSWRGNYRGELPIPLSTGGSCGCNSLLTQFSVLPTALSSGRGIGYVLGDCENTCNLQSLESECAKWDYNTGQYGGGDYPLDHRNPATRNPAQAISDAIDSNVGGRPETSADTDMRTAAASIGQWIQETNYNSIVTAAESGSDEYGFIDARTISASSPLGTVRITLDDFQRGGIPQCEWR